METSWPRSGFLIIERLLKPAQTDDLAERLGHCDPTLAGTRNLLDLPEVVSIARDPSIAAVARRLLSERAFAVRAILFDKTPATNWALGFHQDTKIAMRQKIDAPGYTSWSVKEGVYHVRPPVSVLQRQIAVRIHLDDCGLDNGPVEVIPGTHRNGLLEEPEIAELVERGPRIACTGPVGSALVFRSLLLHGSSRATAPTRRRVLHIEFTDAELPAGLEWNWRILPLS